MPLQLSLTLLSCLVGFCLLVSFANPEPLLFAGFAFSRTNCVLGLLVTIVGAVVAKYSRNYLDGDPKLDPFVRYLVLSVFSALVMMLADNLLILVGGWAVTSIGLHYLLTHYRSEPDATIVARKKFLISRLGDIALLVALGLIYLNWGTLSLSHLFEQTRSSHEALVLPVWLICLAAITKSAQFPFHTWLPDTLAAPTPVSALMHAGIINGGGALLLKFSPALVQVPQAGLFLAIVGSFTMVVGMVSMWGQTSIKRKLAWSTVGQMGFMTAECGMSAYVAALIHIVAHGLYKATSFLNSGTVETRNAKTSRISGWNTIGLLVFGALVALPIQIVIHPRPLQPSDWSVVAILSLAVGQVMVALSAHLSATTPMLRYLVLTVSSQLIALVAAVLMRFTSLLFPFPSPEPSAAFTLAAVLPVATVFCLSAYRAFQPEIRTSKLGRAIAIHSQAGFYLGMFADKLVSKISNPMIREAN